MTPLYAAAPVSLPDGSQGGKLEVRDFKKRAKEGEAPATVMTCMTMHHYHDGAALRVAGGTGCISIVCSLSSSPYLLFKLMRRQDPVDGRGGTDKIITHCPSSYSV